MYVYAVYLDEDENHEFNILKIYENISEAIDVMLYFLNKTEGHMTISPWDYFHTNNKEEVHEALCNYLDDPKSFDPIILYAGMTYGGGEQAKIWRCKLNKCNTSS